MHSHQPSSTAVLIARSILLAAHDGPRRPLVAPAEAETMARLLAQNPTAWFDFASRHRWLRQLLFQGEFLLLRGIITHYLARKRWLENITTTVLATGCTQVVVLGAGFDSLAWRLHRDRPGVRFFEVDHPATQAAKRAALRVESNFTFLAADLATVLPGQVLRACPICCSRRRSSSRVPLPNCCPPMACRAPQSEIAEPARAAERTAAQTWSVESGYSIRATSVGLSWAWTSLTGRPGFMARGWCSGRGTRHGQGEARPGPAGRESGRARLRGQPALGTAGHIPGERPAGRCG